MDKKKWTIWSGEGTVGNKKTVWATDIGLKRILTAERCGGDRWAYACDADDIVASSCAALCREMGEDF